MAGQGAIGGGVYGNGVDLSALVLTGPLGLKSYTIATLPSAATAGAGAMVYASDYGVDGAVLRSNGTRWKPLGGLATLKSLDTPSASIGTAETIVFQYQMPANLLVVKDRLRLRFAMTKSGSTDLGTMRLRVGAAGTTADTQVLSQAPLTATILAGAIDTDWRVESATSLLKLGITANGSPLGYSQTSTTAAAAAVTISNINTSLFVSVSILSAGVSDTVILQDAQLQLFVGT